MNRKAKRRLNPRPRGGIFEFDSKSFVQAFTILSLLEAVRRIVDSGVLPPWCKTQGFDHKVCLCGIPMDCRHHEDCGPRLKGERPPDCAHVGTCPAVDKKAAS